MTRTTRRDDDILPALDTMDCMKAVLASLLILLASCSDDAAVPPAATSSSTGTGGAAGGTASGGVGGVGGASDGGGGSGGHGGTEPRPPDPELDAKCTPGFDLEMLDTDPARQALFLDAVGGDPEALVQDIGRKVCRILYRDAEEVPDSTHLTLRIEYAVGDVAWKAGEGADITVMISTDHLQNLANQGADMATEVIGILFHEMAHMYQHDDHDGDGVDGGLIEGIADFVRIEAGYTPTGAEPSGEGSWNEGYTHTGFFLVWVDDQYDDFVYALNLSMSSEDGKTWTLQSFVDITGKTVDQLWDEYRDSL